MTHSKFTKGITEGIMENKFIVYNVQKDIIAITKLELNFLCI